MTIVSLLRKSKTLIALKSDLNKLTRLFWLLKRKQLISKYLASSSIKKLQIGSNASIIEGWLSSDLVPVNKTSIYLDATQKFPFADKTFDYVYNEHMIEHISRENAEFMLKECFRILKPKGRIRIATPDIEKIVNIYSKRTEKYGQSYSVWMTHKFINESSEIHPLIILNTMFRNWDHCFLYDSEYLTQVLSAVGFTNLKQYTIGNSDDIHLSGIERHHLNVGNLEMVEFETMIFEAEKTE